MRGSDRTDQITTATSQISANGNKLNTNNANGNRITAGSVIPHGYISDTRAGAERSGRGAGVEFAMTLVTSTRGDSFELPLPR